MLTAVMAPAWMGKERNLYTNDEEV